MQLLDQNKSGTMWYVHWVDFNRRNDQVHVYIYKKLEVEPEKIEIRKGVFILVFD